MLSILWQIFKWACPFGRVRQPADAIFFALCHGEPDEARLQSASWWTAYIPYANNTSYVT